MAGSTTESWHQFIKQVRNRFAEKGCRISLDVADEYSLRSAFEKLCTDRHEYNFTRWLSKLNFASIYAVARAIDATFGLASSESLAALVSGACFTTIYRGNQTTLEIAEIVGMISPLNDAVPFLQPDIPRFPEDTDVQSALQNVLITYLDALYFTIDAFSIEPLPSVLDIRERIQARTEEAAAQMLSSKMKYDTMLNRAQQEKSRAMTQPWSFGGRPPDDHKRSHSSSPRFTYHKFLGRGSSGEVHAVRESSTNAIYARKVIYVDHQALSYAELQQEVEKECETMKKLPHIHIVRVLFSQQDEEAFYIYMEPVADSDLRVYLDACVKEGFPESSLRSIQRWVGCLLSALRTAHQHHVIHQDIKLSNILVKAERDGPRVFLADFGLAKDFETHGASTTVDLAVRGTPIYRAPEVRPGQKRGRAADMFSLGCVFSEMLTVCCQKSLEDYQEYRCKPDADIPYAFRSNIPKVTRWVHDLGADQDDDMDSTNGWLVALIRSMIYVDPEQRPESRLALANLRGTDQARRFFCDICHNSS